MMPKPLKCFISYSHKNKEQMESVYEAIKPLEDNEYITIVYDRAFDNTSDLSVHIADALEECNIFLPLFSTAYCASSVSQNIEMKRALERKALGECFIIPIILQECAWEHHDLAKQAELYHVVENNNFNMVCVKISSHINALNKKYKELLEHPDKYGDAFTIKMFSPILRYDKNSDINTLNNILVDIVLKNNKKLEDYFVPSKKNLNEKERKEKIKSQYQEIQEWIEEQKYPNDLKEKIKSILPEDFDRNVGDADYWQKFLLVGLPEGGQPLMQLYPFSEVFRTPLNNEFLKDYYRSKQDVHEYARKKFVAIQSKTEQSKTKEVFDTIRSKNIWNMYYAYYNDAKTSYGRYASPPPLSFLFNEYLVETLDNKAILVKKLYDSNILATLEYKRDKKIKLNTATDERSINNHILQNNEGNWTLNYYDLLLEHLNNFFGFRNIEKIKEIIDTIELHSIVLQKNTLNSSLLSHVKLNIKSDNEVFKNKTEFEFKGKEEIKEDMIEKFKYSDNYNSLVEWHTTAPHRLLYWLNKE